jgi:hypothetical protein
VFVPVMIAAVWAHILVLANRPRSGRWSTARTTAAEKLPTRKIWTTKNLDRVLLGVAALAFCRFICFLDWAAQRKSSRMFFSGFIFLAYFRKDGVGGHCLAGASQLTDDIIDLALGNICEP